jgi:putative polyketide hydroxylase
MECILSFMRHHVRSTGTTPVLIVGAGPAGLTAAITLARAGVETLVVERRTQVSDLPRATGVSTATMELLRSWGLEERVRAGAVDVEWQALQTASLAEAASGTPVEVGYPTRAQSAVVSPTRPACIPQNELEPILQEHLASLPAARLQRGVEVIAVDSRDDEVEVQVRDAGGVRTILARYLIAADGVRSTVRAALGIGTSGPGHLSTSMAVRFRAPLWDVVGEHRHVIYFLDGNRAMLPVGHGDRWLYARPWDPQRERLADLSVDDLTREVRLAAGVPDLDPQLEDCSTADYGVALADRFRERSAFLIGDAAHRLTPRGATGMNTAIRDAHDLGWKLSWVLRGWAGDALLDTYEAERRPVAEHNAARSADPSGSIRGTADELRADLGGRIAHTWLPGESGRTSTLDLLADGLTRFTGPDETAWITRRAAPPVTTRRLDAMTARALGILGGASLLVRPDGVPAAA